MTTEPLISVVVATYTLERLLDLYAAVDSVRSQTVQPLETIVVVDHNDALLRRAVHAAGRSLVSVRQPAVTSTRGDPRRLASTLADHVLSDTPATPMSNSPDSDNPGPRQPR